MLQTRLLNIMQRELESQNLQFSEYCKQPIEQLVGNGMKRMRTSNALDHAGHVMQAERNLRSLVQYFGEYSRQAGTFPRLSNSQFNTALATCPTFWPYCSSG